MEGMNGKRYTFGANLTVTLLNSKEKIQKSEENREVALQYFRVKVAEVIDEAKNFILKNENEEAKGRLSGVISELKGSKYVNEILIKALLVDLNDCLTNLNAEMMEQKARGHME